MHLVVRNQDEFSFLYFVSAGGIGDRLSLSPVRFSSTFLAVL